MNILEKIAAHKRVEVAESKEEVPLEALELLPHFKRKCISLKERLQQFSTGIIAEFKRRSPSHPEINLEAEVEKIALGYAKAGAAGISVLTDEEFFGGSLDDLMQAREAVNLPLLRKDFIIDEYQIYEAKAAGADVILLIAAILNRNQIARFAKTAKKLGLEVLLEVHNEEELERSLMPNLDMIGVNNRNLKTFEIDLENSKNLAEKIPAEYVKISESGISETVAIKELQKSGFQGFLIGGNFMATNDPGKSAAEFIKELKG
ncbi:indole-3-glycerol phosphate synthase [Salinimicrobium catena]|uniref:Indole-3-glycerol phosphate synthase n=1 Tax=Salinimicrobium catena TaxID=390640 RepID=A0A1H5NNA8_9FLAO|nr:indole-3-glycerol phosphate synthase TrpC [Salinimicrobium catena]SDL56272.1 indole-3-glycerol phosphate synthase [Salinimicrobium catena]SEF03149.1 indole-3-glycerol phosphate synthase [Salinimicrobium catena]